ncbi:MAG TPA: N-6 DNA methylase [bacterium]|nr:N-6 DNA methylase [bacterium]
MPAPKELLDLIKNFDENLEEHTGASFNEDTTKSQFIDPFFEILGWDVSNKSGKPESWRDVLRQHSIPSGPTREAPDYIFKIGKTEVFIVEAKKPSIRIKQDAKAALQVRSYIWNRKLPIAILTNFHEFAVYRRQQPRKSDKPDVGLADYFLYKDYAERWDDIYNIFSRDAVEHGKLEKFIESRKAAKGTIEVDDAFLREIEHWRKLLAANIALRNSKLTQQQLNFAVQATIDRIIFLRIAEDRAIENAGRLLSVTNGERIYLRLFKIFEEADDRYNSGLFHFRDKDRTTEPDSITPYLKIDDDKLRIIIRSLYDNFYDFSLMPVEILGQIYEKFLGNVIILTEGHQARVREKPEVKKAGGVFYTPSYIVEYIAANTVEKLLEGKTPAQAAKMKILDPACGSGSFLLGAYQKLLDWHLEYYTEKTPEKYQKQIYPVLGGGYRLTTAEKKCILCNNIFGVDIDPQAVEVTKLSLLLKVLENETYETLKQFKLIYKERALPDLGDNIKCGNSLIGPDIYHNHQMNFLEDEERYRINAFDWKGGFPGIFKGNNPGFDVVIGNPPYGASFESRDALYFKNHYSTFQRVRDVYVLFIEKCLGLLKNGARFSFIVPSAWLGGPEYDHLRKLLLAHRIDNLIQLPFDVFADAYVDNSIFVLSKEKPTLNHKTYTYIYDKREKLLKIDLKADKYQQVKQCHWKRFESNKIVLDANAINILGRLQKTAPLTFNDAIKMKRGVLFENNLLTTKRTSSSSYQYFEGDVYRYQLNLVLDHWVEFGEQMTERPKEICWFEGERILLRRLVNRRQRLMATFTKDSFITNKNIYCILATDEAIKLYFILGLLNSKLISYLYIHQISQAAKDDFPQVTIHDILSLPFPPKDRVKSLHDEIVKMVIEMLKLNQQVEEEWLQHQKTVIKRQAEATDRKIDELVYKLYGLGEEEIKIVEAEK